MHLWFYPICLNHEALDIPQRAHCKSYFKQVIVVISTHRLISHLLESKSQLL